MTAAVTVLVTLGWLWILVRLVQVARLVRTMRRTLDQDGPEAALALVERVSASWWPRWLR